MKQYWKKLSLLFVCFAIIVLAEMFYPSLTSQNKMTHLAFASPQNQEVTVYRDPSCGCCGKWIKHMEENGFSVKNIQTNEMEAIKESYNLPPKLASCHTAIIAGYILEGHVPADDVKQLLQQHSPIAGLAVPGMVTGSPGMESEEIEESFAVIGFDEHGKSEVFKEYLSDED